MIFFTLSTSQIDRETETMALRTLFTNSAREQKLLVRDLKSTVKRLCAHVIMWEQIHEVQGDAEGTTMPLFSLRCPLSLQELAGSLLGHFSNFL